MGLLDRVRAATAPVVAQTEPVRLLPFDCCAEFLEDHPLVEGLRMSVPDLHTALISLDAHLEAEERARRQREERTNPPPDPRDRCIDCGAPCILLNATGGVYVCDACGVEQTRRSINVTPEFVTPAVMPARKRPKTIPGVPNWLVERTRVEGSDEPQHASHDYMEDLEHFNHYIGLSYEQLQECNHNLQRWTGGRCAHYVRVVAAMLHPLIRDQFLDDGTVRRSVNSFRQHVDGRCALPTVSDPTPAPRFECLSCGAMQHNARAARFHCKRTMYNAHRR